MFKHAIWLVGFRPFFTLAFASGVLLPVVWALAFSGAAPLPLGGLAPNQWHAHEMLFGFGWAVLGGFLLTASKNWVHIRGMHGGPLALAALLWLVERGAIFLPLDGATGVLTRILLNACTAFVGGYVVWSLVKYRSQDTFKDNGFFVVGLPLFLVAKNLLLTGSTWITGMAMAIGMFRLAFAVMFERTMTQFMKNAMGVELPRWRWLDMTIKSLVLLAMFQALLPVPVAIGVLAAAGALLFLRLLTWKPHLGLKRFDIGIMYVGYFGLVVHFALEALRLSGGFVGIGSLSVHAFTFLCMGLIIPAMLIRICQGHTGRKLLFTATDRVGFAAMGLASFFRLVATQLWPAQYASWITLAAIGWSACFLLIGVRVAPFLWQPRVDGKEH